MTLMQFSGLLVVWLLSTLFIATATWFEFRRVRFNFNVFFSLLFLLTFFFGFPLTSILVFRFDVAVAPPEILLQAAKWPDGEKNVLIVGHQPTLGAAIRLMLTGTSGPWTVRKSGVWWLARRERGDDSQVVVRAVIDTDHM